ncbi:MAG TPA: TetR/AcrR family transcriptional regulator [Polyangiaceae bacterium]|jgi:AcrR family transcriptional regulator|nr:TetR/AcrR family transcriptional regulator [Polyangiaceae bacterium]
MPRPTFFALPAERRDRLVREAIAEFSERSYADASLSQIAQRSRIPKGSFYQYFDDKVDLYRWLVTDEAPRHKRAFLAAAGSTGDFWADFESLVERGMAFLVEHPRLARLTAAAADPTASPEVRGLHRAICEAGIDEFRALLERGVEARAIRPATLDLDVAARLVAAIIGPGLTDVVLRELGAELHEILASDTLRKKLGPSRRRRLAHQATLLVRGGLGTLTIERKKKGHA